MNPWTGPERLGHDELADRHQNRRPAVVIGPDEVLTVAFVDAGRLFVRSGAGELREVAEGDRPLLAVDPAGGLTLGWWHDGAVGAAQRAPAGDWRRLRGPEASAVDSLAVCSGHGALVFERVIEGSETPTVFVVGLREGFGFGPEVQLGTSGRAVTGAAAAMATVGGVPRLHVAWTEEDEANEEWWLWVASGAVDDRGRVVLGAARCLAESREIPLVRPQLAADERGDAWLVAHRLDQGLSTWVHRPTTGWTDERRLADTSLPQLDEVALAAAPTGHAVAAWTELHEGRPLVYARRLDGGPAVRISDADEVLGEPVVAVAPDGAALVAWAQLTAGRRSVRAATSEGGGFGPPVILPDPLDVATGPVCALGPGGGWVAWTRESVDGRELRTHVEGARWQVRPAEPT